MRRRTLYLWFSFFVLAIGCQKEAPPAAVPAAPRQTAAKLTVLVVDDSELAAGLKLLRGEWAERTSGQLEVQEWSVDQMLAASELSADLIIYPSRYVGTLVDRDWLRPVRKSVLRSSDVALDDMFPLIRNVALRYGNQVYGLSLGESPLMLTGNAETVAGGPRPTWQRLEFPLVHWQAPLQAPRAIELIARAVTATEQKNRTAFLFDADSMQPKLVNATFVRAIEEMFKLEKKRGGALLLKQSAISWPTSSFLLPAMVATDAARPMAFRPLPVAEQVYNPIRKTWELSDKTESIAMLGFVGRSASVTRSTRNSASAFKLLTWMLGESTITQLSPRSEATLWFRKSQTNKTSKWLARRLVDDESVAAANRLLSSDKYYLLPRIPGVDEYLHALDTAIEGAISADQQAEKTLAKVSGQWNAITDRYGRDRQRVAYRKHLGLEDSSE